MTSRILFILGAGVSVSSGIPTYRGEGGLYQNDEMMNLMTPKSFRKDPHSIWKLLDQLHGDHKEIGISYRLLEKIIREHPESYVVTQNIDGFIDRINVHKKRVWEIHGQVRKMRCERCDKVYPTNFHDYTCSCGQICRPNVVLFGESINEYRYIELIKIIKTKPFDYVVIIGTTLTFWYLEKLVMTNKTRGCVNIININPQSLEVMWKYDQWSMTSDEGLEKLYRILTE